MLLFYVLVLKESIPRQVGKKSAVSKEERAIWNFQGEKTTVFFFFALHSLESFIQDSLVAQIVKPVSAMQETWVLSLRWEDPLEKEMATPVQYPCLENPMEPGGLPSMELQRVGHS